MESLLREPAFWTIVLFILPLLLRVPIAVALGMGTIFVVWHWGLGYQMLSYSFFAGIAKFPLLAIPFFILAGVIMEKVGIAERIINLIKQLVGDMTGGLAVATVIVAAFWGAVSGSGPATVAALGLILIPGMAEAGYDKAFAAATVSVASGLAIIIPPSISFIVYGDIMQQSVGTLFAAGVFPGIVVASCLCVAVYLVSKKRGYRGEPRGSASVVLKSLRDAFWGLFTPVIILGGIYGGIFTPTEASAVAAVYGAFIGLFVYKDLKWKEIPKVLLSAATSTTMIMYVVGAANLFGWILTNAQVPHKIAAGFTAMTSNPFVFLMLVNVLLLFIGCLLNASAAVVILTPILLPVALQLGIDPVFFGVLMVVNLAIGCITPPVGLDLFVVSSITKISIDRIMKDITPYLVALLVVLVILTWLPGIILFLPRLLGGA